MESQNYVNTIMNEAPPTMSEGLRCQKGLGNELLDQIDHEPSCCGNSCEEDSAGDEIQYTADIAAITSVVVQEADSSLNYSCDGNADDHIFSAHVIEQIDNSHRGNDGYQQLSNGKDREANAIYHSEIFSQDGRNIATKFKDVANSAKNQGKDQWNNHKDDQQCCADCKMQITQRHFVELLASFVLDDTCHDIGDAAAADPKQPSNHSEPDGGHNAHLHDEKRKDSEEDGDHGVQDVIS